MLWRAPRVALVSVAAVALGVSACAGGRIEGGVYRSAKGYRVALPGEAWTVAAGSRADLELRHRTGVAGMLANALCERAVSGRTLTVLTRHALAGLRERAVVERREVSLNGRRAAHTVLEGRMAEATGRVRVELYVMKSERCVYDLMYVAPPAAFATWRADFGRFVESFAAE